MVCVAKLSIFGFAEKFTEILEIPPKPTLYQTAVKGCFF
jgi:hypothetical protein